MNPESSTTASLDTSWFAVASKGKKHPVFVTATSAHAMPRNDDMHGNDTSMSADDDDDNRSDEDDNGNCVLPRKDRNELTISSTSTSSWLSSSEHQHEVTGLTGADNVGCAVAAPARFSKGPWS
jgi:hypothetical protein